MLRVNQRVRIEHPNGVAIGRVEQVSTLVDVGAETRAALESWGATRLAAITYRTAPESQFLMEAVEIDGQWFDLDRQPIELEIVGEYTTH